MTKEEEEILAQHYAELEKYTVDLSCVSDPDRALTIIKRIEPSLEGEESPAGAIAYDTEPEARAAFLGGTESPLENLPKETLIKYIDFLFTGRKDDKE